MFLDVSFLVLFSPLVFVFAVLASSPLVPADAMDAVRAPFQRSLFAQDMMRSRNQQATLLGR